MAAKDARERWPELYDPEWLGEQLAVRGYGPIAADLGCGKSTVARAAKQLGARTPVKPNAVMVEPLIGQRFGMLVVRERGPGQPRSGNARVYCDCDCGGTTLKTVYALLHKGSGWDHCGCQSQARWSAVGKANEVHGHSGSGGRRKMSPTYSTWTAMRDRCYRPATNGYDRYGGAGIVVCDRWRDSFANFLADMGERPSGMTLDRINPEGNYEPDNCRWATAKTQIANRRAHYATRTRQLEQRVRELEQMVRDLGGAP